MYATCVFIDVVHQPLLQVCWESRGLYIYIIQPDIQFLSVQASTSYIRWQWAGKPQPSTIPGGVTQQALVLQ